ncbi:MAG TPA: LysR family transcriptional regulator [Rubrivivax sp.]|nr:LysR family transcriptional regulator [Rubrivivax sp.]
MSKAIAELEATFGVRLFDRSNRGVIATPQGEVLLRRAAGVFEELRQAVDELRSLTDADRGDLRLGGTPAMCAGLLPHAIGAVRGRRPGFRFQVAELESGKLAGEVAGRSLDFGLGREPPAGGNDDLAFEPLFDDRLFIVAGAQHPLAGRRSVTLAQTARYPWALPQAEGAVTVHLQGEFRRQGLSLPESGVTTMSMLVRCELAATNTFLTVMYGSVLRFGSRHGSLRVLPVDLPSGIPVGMVRVKNRSLAPSAEVFMQALREIVRPMHSLSARQLGRKGT